MEWLRQCILSVVIASVICSVILCLMPKGMYFSQIRFLCGCYLLLILIGKKQQVRWVFPDLTESEGSREAAYGEELAQQAFSQFITEQTQAYILSKGEELGAELHVTVFLNEEQVPQRVLLSGAISQESRNTLSRIMTEELGITKENQLWTG